MRFPANPRGRTVQSRNLSANWRQSWTYSQSHSSCLWLPRKDVFDLTSKYPTAERGALSRQRRDWPSKGPDRNRSKSKPNSHCSVSGKCFCCRHSCESRNPAASGFRVAFHLPGMTILLPQMSNFASPPAKPGVYLSAIRSWRARTPKEIIVDGAFGTDITSSDR